MRTSIEKETPSTEQSNEHTENASNADTHSYDIEDSDDDQLTVDEILNLSELKRSKNIARKEAQAGNTTKTATPSFSGSRTISGFLQTSVTESQEKRPISALLESLEEEYRRKSPAKIKRRGITKGDFSLNSPIANSTVIDIEGGENMNPNESAHKSYTIAEIHAEPQQHNADDLLTSDSELESAMLEILTDDDDNNEPIVHSQSEQNNMTSDKSSSSPSNQTTSGYFEGSRGHQDGSQIDANADNSASSNGFKSTKKSKTHHQTTIKEYFDINSPSKMTTSDASSVEKSMIIETDDQGNSDLNSESNQLEALHMASDN